MLAILGERGVPCNPARCRRRERDVTLTSIAPPKEELMSDVNKPETPKPVTPPNTDSASTPTEPPKKPVLSMDIDEVDVSENLERKISA
jgi:hypothetical protein